MLVVGLSIGAFAGILQFLLLLRFTKALAGGGGFTFSTVFIGVGQFFLPVAVLVLCAFLLQPALLWVALGIATVLIVCSLVRFLRRR